MAIGLTLVPLVGAAVADARTREIPDAYPIALLAWAVVARLLGWIAPEWGAAALGLGTGLAAGLALFALGAMGGGDGKLLAGLGAVIGLRGFVVVLAFVAVVGGLFALAARLRGHREVVYGPVILLGYVGAVVVALLSRGG